MADNLDGIYDLQDPETTPERKAEIYKEQRDFLNKQLTAKHEQLQDALGVLVWLMQNGYSDAVTTAKVAIRMEKSK